MNQPFMLPIALACASAIVGCESSHTATFGIVLHNASSQPVTAWITKTGERNADWLAPEDLALSTKTESINGVVIPPGKTGEMGPMSGRFGPEDAAILRIYAGQLDYDHILATSVKSPLRVDIALEEGTNHLEVRAGEKLDVVPTREK